MGFGAWGLGLGVWGLGLGAWGLGLGVWGLGLGAWGWGFEVWGLRFGVWGLGDRKICSHKPSARRLSPTLSPVPPNLQVYRWFSKWVNNFEGAVL